MAIYTTGVRRKQFVRRTAGRFNPYQIKRLDRFGSNALIALDQAP
jgi:hypothetical protein